MRNRTNSNQFPKMSKLETLKGSVPVVKLISNIGFSKFT